MSKIRTATVTAGNFANKTGQSGNFNAKNSIGERFFISKELMHSIGIKTDAEFKTAKRFYAIVGTDKVGVRDEMDKTKFVEGVKNKRILALSVFKTEEEMLLAKTEDMRTFIKERKLIEKEAYDAELSTESLRVIHSASSLV